MRNFITFILLLLFTSVSAQQKEVTLVNKKFTASSIKNLEVQTSGGSIRVNGDAGSEASVEIILNPNGNSRKSGKDLKTIFEEEYDLDLDVRSGKLIAKATRKSSKGNNPLSVSFRISVPAKTATQLKTSGGSIALSNLEGDQDFATSGGSLSIENLKGNITGKTSGGSIKATDCLGKLTLATSGGSLQLQRLSGNITATTSGGSITANQIVGTLDARTSGGSIRLDDSEGAISASTSGGSITASLNKVTNPLQLKTSAGSIRLTLPKGGYNLDLRGTRVNADRIDNFSGSVKKEAINGSINGGGYAIAASTSGGTVSLSWQ